MVSDDEMEDRDADEDADGDDDDEGEGDSEDQRLYCFCQKTSYGEVSFSFLFSQSFVFFVSSFYSFIILGTICFTLFSVFFIFVCFSAFSSGRHSSLYDPGSVSAHPPVQCSTPRAGRRVVKDARETRRVSRSLA